MTSDRPIPTVDQEAELWTADEVARFLRASRSWVYRETSAGRIPSTRVLGLRRYIPAEIKALVEKGKQAPGRVVLPLVPRTS